MEADITVNKIPSGRGYGWTNIFHFSNNGEGDRFPAVYIHKSGYFWISSMPANLNKQVNFVIGQKYHLKIQQFQSEGKTIFEVQINGKTEYSGEHGGTQIKEFDNVKVYVSGPWNPWSFTSEYGLLENFKYCQPVEGKQMTQPKICEFICILHVPCKNSILIIKSIIKNILFLEVSR